MPPGGNAHPAAPPRPDPRVHGRTALEHGLRFNAVRRERADRAAERIR